MIHVQYHDLIFQIDGNSNAANDALWVCIIFLLGHRRFQATISCILTANFVSWTMRTVSADDSENCQVIMCAITPTDS